MMDAKMLAVAAALAGLAPSSVRAQDVWPSGPPLTLSEALTHARATHPSLASASAGMEAALASAREAEAARLPSLVTDANFTRFAQPMVVAPLHGFDPQHPPTFDRALVQANLSLGYTLFDGGARGARIDRARAQVASAESGVAAMEQALLAEVAKSYLRVVSSREVRDAQERQLEALAQERTRAERVLAQGRTPRLTLLRADAALSRARAELVGAEEQVQLAERQLARLMGVSASSVSGRPVRVTEKLPAIATTDRDALVSSAVRANTEVVRAQSRLAAALAASDEARAAFLPTVRLAARWNEYGSAEGTFSGEWQSGVLLSYPVFTGGARASLVDRSAAEARAASADIRSAELRVAESVDVALSALAAAGARVTALTVAVDQGVEVVRIEKLALDNGAGVQTDYIAAEAELARSRAALTEARVSAHIARVDLARATGELTAAWLSRALDPN
jgi:outer membrane protein